MDYLSINYKNINSCSKISDVFKKVDKVNVIGYNFKYKLSKEIIYKSILIKLQLLKNEILNKCKDEFDEISILLPLINEKKVTEIQPSFNKISNIYKIKIFSYLYWKYKDENSTTKVNIQNLKKLLGFGHEAKEKFIEAIEVKYICPKCGGDGTIYLYNYELNYMKYKCLTCGHEEENESYYNKFKTLINCNCERCLEIKKELYNVIRNNLRKVIPEIECEFVNEYYKLNDIDKPTEVKMEQDYNVYASSLDKDEREVLTCEPKTIEELMKIIEEIEYRNSKYSIKENNVINKLLSHKFIYNTRSKINKDKFINILGEKIINEFLVFKTNSLENLSFNSKIKYINKLYDYLDTVSIEDFYKKYIGELSFNFEQVHIEFVYFKKYDIYLEKKCFNYNYVINDNYIKKEMILDDNKLLIDKEIIKKTLRSNAEKDIYTILKNKYKEYIVLPNYYLHQLIEIESIRHIVTEKEFKYLETCMVDFAICNNDGYLLKGIELQKGPHHNDPEWIWKDKTKRKPFRILGIAFEEMF